LHTCATDWRRTSVKASLCNRRERERDRGGDRRGQESGGEGEGGSNGRRDERVKSRRSEWGRRKRNDPVKIGRRESRKGEMPERVKRKRRE